jgi:hypothetical protein
MTPSKPKRRQMMAFKITEISAVDRPAQAPALAAILKADNRTPEEARAAEFLKGIQASRAREEAEVTETDLARSRAIMAAYAEPGHMEKAAPSFSDFDAAVEHLEGTGLSRLAALTKAANRFPDLLAGYQRAGARPVDLDAPPPPPSSYTRKGQPKAVTDFDMLVDGIASRRNVSRTKAMAMAQKEHPAAFAAYQAA